MTTKRERCPGGRLVEAWVLANELTKGELFKRVVAAATARGLDPVSRVTMWKWLVGDSSVPLGYALIFEEICGVSTRVWVPQTSVGGTN